MHFKIDKAFYKTLLSLVLPIALQNLINSSLALADTVMVGMLGQNELAGMSLANTPFFVAMLFVFGIQSGGAVLISQYWGKKDIATINRVMGLSIYFAGALSFLFGTAVFFFPREIMGITTNNPQLLDVAARYGRIVAYSYFFNCISSVYLGVQRSMGNPKVGLAVLCTSMALNTFLNWVLIFGKLGAPALGVEGAAIATLISRVVELVLVLIYAFVFSGEFKLMPKYIFKPGKLILGDYAKYTAPVIMNETFWGLGTSIFPIVFGHMQDSSDIVSASSIAGTIQNLVCALVFGLANATAVIIGNSIGAGKSRDEIFSIGKKLSFLSVLIGAFAGGLLLLATFTVVQQFVFPLFGLTENAQRIATMMLCVLSAALIGVSYNTNNIVGILRGGGDVRAGMIIDVLFMYVYAVPAAILSGLVFKADITLVYILIKLEEIIKVAVGFARFISGKWIKNVTRDTEAFRNEPSENALS